MMDVSFERCEKSSSKVSGCPQHTQPSSGDELSILPGCVNNPSHASQQIWESPSQVFVADPCSDLPVGRFCQVMNVSRSVIFAWRQQSLNPSTRAVQDADLSELIVNLHVQSFGTFGRL